MAKRKGPRAGRGAHEGYALLYTATETGKHSGIRFMMTTPDAKAWCSSPLSAGAVYGSQWAYFYTTVANFTRCHWGPQAPKIVIAGLVDNGRWDRRIESPGLTKIGLKEFAGVLTPLGVDVIG